MELRFEDDPLAQSFVARMPGLRARHRALGLPGEESRATIQALPATSPRTTLERALLERMRAGGTWRAPTGVTSLR